MNSSIVSMRGVTRRFGSVVALDDVDLDIKAGELVGLLGPNGAGKSTMISLLTGLRKPDSGAVSILGGNPRDPHVRIGLGCTPQETGLPATLRVGEVIDFVASHFPRPMARGEIMERFGLSELVDRQTASLSGGQRRRLAVALAMVGSPRLLMLDEPTTGLDVDARNTLWRAMRDFHADGGTILLTSHYLEEIEALAERVVVIDRGIVLADASMQEILARVAVSSVRFRLAGEASLHAKSDVVDGAQAGDRVVEALSELGGHTRSSDGRIQMLTADSDALVRAMVNREIPFADLTVHRASLEEAFLALTNSETATREAVR